MIHSHIFNLIDFALLLTTCLALLLVFPLCFKRDRSRRDLFLAGFVLSQGLTTLNYVLIFNTKISPWFTALFTPFHYLPLTFLLLLQAMLLFGYCLTMTSGSWRHHKKLLGISIFVMLVAIPEHISIFSQDELTHSYLNTYPVIVLLACWYGGLAIARVKNYHLKIYQIFSNVDYIQLRWLWICVIGFTCLWVLDGVSFVLMMSGFKWLSECIQHISLIPPLILMSVMVIFSQTLYNNNLIRDNDLGDEDTNEANEDHDSAPSSAMVMGVPQTSEGKTQNYNQQYCDQIVDLMTRVKIYQDPELRLEGLADSLNISTRSVSTLLNGHFKKNFYDFVNEYRVRDAQDQLLSVHNKKKTIQRIFEDAGFSSKTTFNTIFKKYTGKTPTEFRQSTERVMS